MLHYDFRLREAVILDAEAVSILEQHLFPTNSMSECTIINELDRGPLFVVANQHGAVLGYALTHWRNGVIDLLRLGVAPAMQGQGYGSSLLRKVLSVPHQMCVLTVKKSNSRALRLYKSFGFKLFGIGPQDTYVLIRTSKQPIPAHTTCT